MNFWDMFWSEEGLAPYSWNDKITFALICLTILAAVVLLIKSVNYKGDK
jgi:hypothetical protein